MTYHVTAEIDGRFWLVRVLELDRATQARSARQVVAMAKDLIQLMTGEESPDVELTYLLPDAVQAHLSRAETLRADEARARADAAYEIRQAAKTLHETGVPLRDVGTVLGVSHQRAHQLVKSAGTARLWPPPGDT